MGLTLLIGSFFVLTLGIALFALLGTPASRKAARRPYVWVPLLLVVFVTVVGIVWEERMLMRFAKQEGGTIQGLIAKPVPLTTDHRYTPNGRQYLYRGIQIPMTITSALLFAIAFTFSVVLYMRESGRAILALWLATLTGVAAIAVHSVRRFVEAIDLFI